MQELLCNFVDFFCMVSKHLQEHEGFFFYFFFAFENPKQKKRPPCVPPVYKLKFSPHSFEEKSGSGAVLSFLLLLGRNSFVYGQSQFCNYKFGTRTLVCKISLNHHGMYDALCKPPIL